MALYEVLLALFCTLQFIFADAKPSINTIHEKVDGIFNGAHAGEPLILTDLIMQDKIEEAKQLAEVPSDYFKGVKSYSGYFKVDDIYDSNLFFWFFPSQSDFKNDPVLLWLQGGPGASSMFGLFEENGPFFLTDSTTIELRNTSWATSNSVLYIDQPAGTGFSFTNNGYAKNETKVGDDLYNALVQFFWLFPNLSSNDFFIAGESYAGKYIPAIGHKILKSNPSSTFKINLKGLAIGNGFSVPEIQLRYADHWYDEGFIDLNTRNQMDELENQLVDDIQKQEYKKAADLMGLDLIIFGTASGFENMYNYLHEKLDSKNDLYRHEFFKSEDVRNALHVGDATYDAFNNFVFYNLNEDRPKSVAPILTELINNYKVLIYSGQLDLIVPYSGTVKYLQGLDFIGAEEYKKAERTIWYCKGRIAGYAKTAGNLTEVLVRNAGHMVPTDQPEWALDLINRFVRGQSFENV